jgi:hypothetical protein
MHQLLLHFYDNAPDIGIDMPVFYYTLTIVFIFIFTRFDCAGGVDRLKLNWNYYSTPPRANYSRLTLSFLLINSVLYDTPQQIDHTYSCARPLVPREHVRLITFAS